MFEFNGEQYSLEQLQAVAEKKGYTIEELFKKNPTIKEVNQGPTKVEEVKSPAGGFFSEQAKTNAVVEPVAPATAKQQIATNTVSSSEDRSLDSQNPDPKKITVDQFEKMSLDQKRKLNYGDRQRLIAERDAKVRGDLSYIDFTSKDYNKLEDEEKIKLKEAASKKIVKSYNEKGVKNYSISDAELEEESKKILKKATQPSLLETYTYQGVRGFANFIKGVSDFQDLAKFSLVEAGLRAFDPEYKGTIAEKQALMQAAKTEGKAYSVSDNLGTFISSLEPHIRQYENETIVEDLEKGNYLQAGQRAVGAAIESIPSIVAAYTGVGGLVALGASSAGGKFTEEFERDPSKETGILVANALATGGLEAGFELATRGILRRARILNDTGNRRAAEDLIKGGADGLLKNIGINTASEFGSEAATKTATLLLDSATLDRDFDLAKEWRGIIDEGIVGGVFGVSSTGIGKIKNPNPKIVEVAEYVLMPNEIKGEIEKSAKQISKLYKDREVADADSVNLLDEAILSEELKVRKIKSENSAALKNMTPEEIRVYANNKTEIDKLTVEFNKPNQLESVKELAEKKLETLKETNKVLFKESAARRVVESADKVSSMLNQLGSKSEVKLVETNDEGDASSKVIDILKQANLTDQEIQSQIKDYEGSYGFFLADKKDPSKEYLVINKDNILKAGKITTAQHEFFHKLLRNKLSNEKGLSKKMHDLIIGEIDKLEPTVRESFNNTLANYKKDVDNEEINYTIDNYYEEVFVQFSELLANNPNVIKENSITKIKDFVRRIFNTVGFRNVKFETTQDALNFIKDYNSEFKRGKLSKSTTKFSKENITKQQEAKAFSKATDIETKIEELTDRYYDGEIDDIDYEQQLDNLQKKLEVAQKEELAKPQEVKKPKKAEEDIKADQIGDAINKIIPKGTTKKQYDTETIGKVSEKLVSGRMLDPLIKKIAAGYGIVSDNVYGRSWEDFYDAVKGVQLLKNLQKFNPETNDDFGGFVIGSQFGIRNRVKEALTQFKKENEGGFKEDVETAKGIISEEIEIEEGEVKEKILIDPRKSRIVKDKLPEIEESIDIDPATVTTLTFKNVAEKFGGIVAAKIFNIPIKKASDPTANLTYATKIVDGVPEYSEAGNIQNAFTNPQQAKEFIKLLPEFNIAGNEVEVSETGEIIDVSSSAKGYAIGVPNNLIKLMYDTYVDPRSLSDSKAERSRAITSPKGRSKGLTSQATVYRLKPEFTGTISNEAVTKFQDMLGITEKGKLNKYDREIGQVLKSAAKLYGSEVANIIVRDKINKLDIKTSKPKSQVLADIAAGKSSVMFSKAKQIEIVNSNNIDAAKLWSNFNPEKALTGTVQDFNDFKKVFKRDVTKLLKYIPAGYRASNFLGVYSTDIRYIDLKGERLSSRSEKGKFTKRVTELQNIVKKEMNKMAGEPIGFSPPSKEIGETESKVKEYFDIKNRSKLDGKNKKYSKAFDDMWLGFFNAVKEDQSLLPIVSLFLEGANYDVSHPHRKGARVIGYQVGVKPIKNYKGLYRTYEYEHAVQSNIAAYDLYNAMLSMDSFSVFKNHLNKVKENYVLIALGLVDNKKLTDADYRSKMPENWKNWWDRYLNPKVASIDGGIDPESILVIDYNGELATLSDYAGRVKSDGTFFSKNLSEEFNKIIENKTGIAYDKTISEVKAKMIADSKRNFNFFIPPSAEDFVGLLYYTLGKGETGEKQMQFYKRTLLDPYARANQAISRDRNALGRRFKEIKKEFKVTPKDLKNRTPDGLFTKEQAVRVFIWDSIGKEIPGLSEKDVKELVDYVKSDKNLSEFATQVMMLNPGKSYTAPTDTWITGNITTDLLEVLNTSRRAMHLKQWQQNVDAIFSNENLNKLEAAYGTQYRKAMENILTRMKTGRNRTYGTDTLTGRVTDWVNGSVGAIMFLNTRSAVLQTISAVNFINFSDNNVLAAGKALANQKQYWSDFTTLFKSEYLVDRRDGLKVNVNEADIADIAKEKGVRGALNYLLKLGFTPTQIADSFAIASGGATFYRNRIKSLVKKGMDPVAAEKLAMRDFIETAEESQQSSRPDKISQQQAGPLGRIVLAFANTPAQYARLIKKAASDLKNGRGDAKTNISKILYYGAIQNIIFNALQQALFAMTFGDEEEESEKTVNMINGTIDGIARGTGLGGAVFTVVKNTALKLYRDSEKKNPKYEDGMLEMLKISPPISSKVQKLRAAGRTMSWDMDEIKEKGASFDNPAIMAGAKVTSAMFNFPADRAVQKVQNLVDASDSELETYKRLALVGGWSAWELGIKEEEKKKEAKNKSTKRRSSVKKSVLRKTIIR
jgi:hypothetical protein